MRECGKCDLCCVLFSINDPPTEYFPGLKKEAGVRCPHLCSSGCDIYQDKGPVCNKYHCFWIQGKLPEWMKPDETGLLLDRYWTAIPDKVYLRGYLSKPLEEVYPMIDKICNLGYPLAIVMKRGKISNTQLYESSCSCKSCSERRKQIQEQLKKSVERSRKKN